MIRLLTFACSLFLGACASTLPQPASVQPTSESKAVAVKPAPEEVRQTCYEGTSTVRLPDGQSVPGGRTLVRRTLQPSQEKIVEEVISFDSRPEVPPKSFVVDMAVTGSQFKMTERSGAFEGTGSLTGEAWKWSEWASSSRIPNGMVVTSKDTLRPGGMVAKKVVRGAEGQVLFELDEEYTTVDCARFKLPE